jgi:hypothetical protein
MTNPRCRWPLLLGLAAAVAVSGAGTPASGQDAPARLPFQELPLHDLGAFRAPGANWQVVGGVSAERNRRHHLATRPGTGVLANLPGVRGATDLLTEWEHGDLELELEVLMPRGSNSGIYLQGRYEVQLLDSWGVREPRFSDMGGIYERWDPSRPEGSRGFEGQAPRINASRAPGLWQTFRILFQAPRFDAQGNKTANARFVRVVHNGVVIHENVEVTGPTRAAAFDDERPLGPLMLQGDHGPVAFRNLRYKRYTGERLRVSGLRYRAYEGEFGDLTAATAGTPTREGTADGISTAPAAVVDRYALVFEGTLSAPAAGRYLFDLRFDWIDDDPQFAGTVVGGGRLTIGGREVLLHEGRILSAVAEADLPTGEHPFSLTIYKNRPWTNRNAMALYVEGPGIARHALHDESATPSPLAGAIAVQPGAEPVVLRSFVQDGDAKLTHAVSVGDPLGVHYGYDLGRGALLYAWRGPFLEATEMWHARGERQLGQPLGSVLTNSAEAQLAFLDDPSQDWPGAAPAGQAFRPGGYALDEAGRPTFLYRLDGVEVEDRLRPADAGTTLHRELVLAAPDATGGLYVRLADAGRIHRLRDGSYEVGDGLYYVAVERGGPSPVVRESAGRQELLLPVRFRRGAARVAYTIIW